MPHQTESYTYRHDPAAVDIKAYLHFDPAVSENARPLVIVFHGGGWVIGSTALIPQNQIDQLVEWGFAVLCPEYRLCPQVSLFDGPIADAKHCYSWAVNTLPKLLENDNTGVTIDPTKVLLLGHSAGGTLALSLATATPTPTAIVDFYGSKGFDNPFWTAPVAAFNKLPDVSEDFVNKVYTEQPLPTATPPAFVNGVPNMTDPRAAFLLQNLKNGTLMSKVIPDGDMSRVDPFTLMTTTSWKTPTLFIHGSADINSPIEVSKMAYEKLKELGVDTELIVAEGQGHAFDLLKQGDVELWNKYTMPALEFLKRHAGL